jgi:hypothetical protein
VEQAGSPQTRRCGERLLRGSGPGSGFAMRGSARAGFGPGSGLAAMAAHWLRRRRGRRPVALHKVPGQIGADCNGLVPGATYTVSSVPPSGPATERPAGVRFNVPPWAPICCPPPTSLGSRRLRVRRSAETGAIMFTGDGVTPAMSLRPSTRLPSRQPAFGTGTVANASSKIPTLATVFKTDPQQLV